MQQPPNPYPQYPQQQWQQPSQPLPQQQQWQHQTNYGQPQSYYSQQPPTSPQQQWIPQQQWNPQMTIKKHSKRMIGFITTSVIVLTLTFVLGIAVGANLKGSSTSGHPSSTNVSSNSTTILSSSAPTQVATSPTTPIPTLAQVSPAKVGDTISVGDVGCTLVSVNPKPLPGDAFSRPKPGDEFIVVNVKLTNNGVSDVDYLTNDFYARSSSGNTTSAFNEVPSSYTSNNLLDINGTIALEISYKAM